MVDPRLRNVLRLSVSRSNSDRKERFPRRFAHEPRLYRQSISVDTRVGPANHCVSPQHRHCIVTAYAFGCGCVCFETIRPTPKVFEPSPVPNQWIERCQKSDLPRQIVRSLPVSDRRPDISHAVDGLPFQFSGSKQCLQRAARIAPATIAGNRRSKTLLRYRSKNTGDDQDEFSQALV